MNEPHDPTIKECPECGGPVVGFRPPDYPEGTLPAYFCAECNMVMWCACDMCEAFKALVVFGEH